MFTVGRLVGSCSPATDNDGHATKRPSTFFEHRRRLIQPTRKPTGLTNPSTKSDQVHARVEVDEVPRGFRFVGRVLQDSTVVKCYVDAGQPYVINLNACCT